MYTSISCCRYCLKPKELHVLCPILEAVCTSNRCHHRYDLTNFCRMSFLNHVPVPELSAHCAKDEDKCSSPASDLLHITAVKNNHFLGRLALSDRLEKLCSFLQVTKSYDNFQCLEEFPKVLHLVAKVSTGVHTRNQ